MSHRCYICDWSPSMPSSIYYSGLAKADYEPKKRLLLEEGVKGSFICSSCFEEALHTRLTLDNNRPLIKVGSVDEYELLDEGFDDAE